MIPALDLACPGCGETLQREAMYLGPPFFEVWCSNVKCKDQPAANDAAAGATLAEAVANLRKKLDEN